jgi:four helix bundle protein
MLRIVDVIIDLIRVVAPLVDAIGRHDRALAGQLRDALNSTLLNTAEASDQRGARRTNQYCMALGSARESFAALRAAEAWRFIGPLPKEVTDMLNRIIGTLVRVVARH